MLLLHLLHISAAHRQHFLLSINWGQLGFLSPQCKEIDAPGKDSVNWVVIPVACHKRSQKMGGRFLLSLGIPKILYSPERWILFLNQGFSSEVQIAVTWGVHSSSEHGWGAEPGVSPWTPFLGRRGREEALWPISQWGLWGFACTQVKLDLPLVVFT